MPNKDHVTVYQRLGRVPLLTLCIGSIVVYRDRQHNARIYGKLKIGIVLDRGNVPLPNIGRHPFKKLALRTNKRISQHYVKVESMEKEIDFIQSKYVNQVIPPNTSTILLTFDDVKEIIAKLGKEHPTAVSIASQVAIRPIDKTSVNTAIEKARELFDYVKEMNEPGLSKKIVKKYYKEHYGETYK